MTSLEITQSPISLSTPLGKGDDSTLGEFIEDQNSPNPNLCTMQNNFKEVLEEVIQSLSDREARVLKMRFGIDFNMPRIIFVYRTRPRPLAESFKHALSL